MNSQLSSNWKIWFWSSLFGIVILLGIASISRIWVLTAIPIGFLFGFFLERADLCGSSACSEVVMMHDARKMGGIWIAIITSMLLFAVGSGSGWIDLAPKPLIWANYIIGGIIFGVGIVLAGGCVSGCLFKVGQGNLNSMAALVSIPIGVSAVAYGPLKAFNKALKTHIIKNADGSSVTLSSVTGIPYWILALVFIVGTLAVILLLAKKRRNQSSLLSPDNKPVSLFRRTMTRGWQPWKSGVAIGVLALFAYLSSAASGRNYPLGVTHGVLDIMVLATETPVKSVWKVENKPGIVSEKPDKEIIENPVKSPGEKKSSETPEHRKHVVWWLVGLVVALVAGSHVSARMRGNFHLRPKPPDETIIAFFGVCLSVPGLPSHQVVSSEMFSAAWH